MVQKTADTYDWVKGGKSRLSGNYSVVHNEERNMDLSFPLLRHKLSHIAYDHVPHGMLYPYIRFTAPLGQQLHCLN